jgi:hypothetical protein
MKKVAFCLVALFFIASVSTSVFAGKQPDVSFHSEAYRYDIIEGKVTAVDEHFITIEGQHRETIYNEDTKFYRGDESVAIEKVYGGKVFKDCETITSSQVKSGDYIKARWSDLGDGGALLEVCLIVKK